MLVLTRKHGQSIRIGPEIEIKVIEIKGRLVRLGVEAPRQIQVFRQELAPAEMENRANPPSLVPTFRRLAARLMPNRL